MARKSGGRSDSERVAELFQLWRDVMATHQLYRELSEDAHGGTSVESIDRLLVRQLNRGMGVATLKKIVRTERALALALSAWEIEKIFKAQKDADSLWSRFASQLPDPLQVIVARGVDRSAADRALGDERVQRTLWTSGAKEAAKFALALLTGVSASTISRDKKRLRGGRKKGS